LVYIREKAKMFKSQSNINIKIVFLFLIIIVGALFFIINRKITNEFRTELNNQVRTIVNVYHQKVLYSEDNSDYLLEVLVPLIDELNIPVIIKTQLSDGSFTYEHLNLDIPYKENSDDYKSFIENTIITMDQDFDPLTIIEYDNVPLIQIHYGDTDLINTIRWIPFIEISFFIILLLFIVLIYRILNLSENNSIYVGMAKETAHQLGTPISSLMGWVDLIKKKPDDKEIIKEFEKEVQHLENISNKFNKIGSNPKLIKIDLNSILIDIVSYYNKRIPRSKDLEIKLDVDNNYFILGDDVLIYWAIENLIKNSIDSIKNEEGFINIKLKQIDNYINIYITDNGVGINNKDRNKIFKPGYSTKKRGWGLGLSLSKRIIKDIHHGKIKLYKSNTNETIFVISFRNFSS